MHALTIIGVDHALHGLILAVHVHWIHLCVLHATHDLHRVHSLVVALSVLRRRVWGSIHAHTVVSWEESVARKWIRSVVVLRNELRSAIHVGILHSLSRKS